MVLRIATRLSQVHLARGRLGQGFFAQASGSARRMTSARAPFSHIAGDCSTHEGAEKVGQQLDEAALKRAQVIFSSHGPAERAMVVAVAPSKYRLFQRARQEKRPMRLGNCPDLNYITKRPQDSLLKVLLPFASNPDFAANYINFKGRIRVGMLLEDLDAFATTLAHIHCDDGKDDVEPPLIVTVSADQISLLAYPLEANCDMMLVGMVTAAGSSSMCIDIDLVGLPTASRKEHKAILQASFSFVARNAQNKPVAIPKIKPVSDLEIKLNEQGLRGMEDRKQVRKLSLYKKPPTASELALIHELFLETQRLTHSMNGHALVQTPKGTIGWMDDYKSTSVVLTMPQERNVHGRIFGGFLMRSAYELAFAHAWKTTGVAPHFLSLDSTDFLLPVEVGYILSFEATTTYSPGPAAKTYCVEVSAKMLSPAAAGGLTAQNSQGVNAPSPEGVVTNSFAFTFYCDNPSKMPRLLPRYYADAMRFLEAERRVAYGGRLADQRKASGAPSIRFPL